jgi:predicted membrane-bound spermidine synthase
MQMKKRISPWQWRLIAVAFISGFALMAFELAAARVLAPSIGSTLYIWTAVIGVIIAALSVGYWLGGRIADRRNQSGDVTMLHLAAGGLVVGMLCLYPSVLAGVPEAIRDQRLQGLIASLILFAPTSLLLGIISPYLAKLNIDSLQTAGSRVADLSAINALGGICGTFVTGFVLFGYLGSHETFLIVAAMLLVAAWLLTKKNDLRLLIAASALIVTIGSLTIGYGRTATRIDTPTAHYVIADERDDQGTPVARHLITGPRAIQSSISLADPTTLQSWYTQRMVQMVEDAPRKDAILILGGGTYTMPHYLAKKYPSSVITVVEIDDKLESIATEYFKYQQPANVVSVAMDARAYVNRATAVYDVILVDVYNDSSIPFSLATKEFGDKVAQLVRNDGIIGVNIIASLEDDCRPVLGLVDAAYRQHFAHTRYDMRDPIGRTNIVASYSNDDIAWGESSRFDFAPGKSYTDNFAPIERMQQQCSAT